MPDPVASKTGNGTKTNDLNELRLSEGSGTRAGHWSCQNYANSDPDANGKKPIK